MPEPKFQVGDHVRLIEDYGTHNAGELFTVTAVNRATYITEYDTYLVAGTSDKGYGTSAGYEFRFEKVEDKKEALVSDIKWKSVDYYDYASHEDTPESPSRVTYYGEVEVFEIGTVPVKLPTKRGAIVAPPKDNEKWATAHPYVLSTNGNWYELMSGGFYSTATGVVQSYLDQGWLIAFEGVDND